MRDVLGAGTILGYCTNVHAGATLKETKANLEKHALAVKRIVSPDSPMGVGLWLSARAVAESLEPKAGLGPWLAERGLEAFTLNGFPMGDFHVDRVKHSVYEPNWGMRDRQGYTLGLVEFLRNMPDAAGERSISTLPAGWPGPPCKRVNMKMAGQHMIDVASMSDFTMREKGLLVHLDLEPEPGCLLQRSQDVVKFVHQRVDRAPMSRGLRIPDIRRHVRVCHDVCHAAVMFEPQAEVLKTYRAAGIKVGKVQISNAIRVPFDEYSPDERREALAQLAAFAEDRYLHQTMIRRDDGSMEFFEDLPLALKSVEGTEARGEWRVHFHVPLFVERFGLIQTTQHEIVELMNAITPGDEIHHFEVETYAWNVLPPELRAGNLAEGIAKEMQWVIDRFGSRTAVKRS